MRTIQLKSSQTIPTLGMGTWRMGEKPNTIVIPKFSRIDHIEQNYAAQSITLNSQEIETLNTAFPAPSKPIPLQML